MCEISCRKLPVVELSKQGFVVENLFRTSHFLLADNKLIVDSKLLSTTKTHVYEGPYKAIVLKGLRDLSVPYSKTVLSCTTLAPSLISATNSRLDFLDLSYRSPYSSNVNKICGKVFVHLYSCRS